MPFHVVHRAVYFITHRIKIFFGNHVGLQYILDREEKRERETDTSVMIELRDQSNERKCPLPHAQCNTGHALPAIPFGVRAEAWSQPSEPEVQQEPVVYLLLESAIRRDEGIAGRPIPPSTQSSEPAQAGGTEADSRHAQAESEVGHDRVLVEIEAARLYPSSGKPVPRHAKAGHVSGTEAAPISQVKALRTDALSWTARTDRRESGASCLYRGPGTAAFPIYRYRRVQQNPLPRSVSRAKHLFLR